jgi:hypothetical protein
MAKYTAIVTQASFVYLRTVNSDSVEDAKEELERRKYVVLTSPVMIPSDVRAPADCEIETRLERVYGIQL